MTEKIDFTECIPVLLKLFIGQIGKWFLVAAFINLLPECGFPSSQNSIPFFKFIYNPVQSHQPYSSPCYLFVFLGLSGLFQTLPLKSWQQPFWKLRSTLLFRRKSKNHLVQILIHLTYGTTSCLRSSSVIVS